MLDQRANNLAERFWKWELKKLQHNCSRNHQESVIVSNTSKHVDAGGINQTAFGSVHGYAISHLNVNTQKTVNLS